MNILIIPDTHLRKFWRQTIFDNIGKVDKVIFLGDYFDPYNEPDLEDDPLLMMNNIINLKKEEPDKYFLLLGNHDCHYIWDSYPQSSRYNHFRAKDYYNIFLDNLNLFNIDFVQDDVIFSHAGITEKWANEVSESFKINNSIIDVALYLQDLKLYSITLKMIKLLGYVSYYRYGPNECGSCEWADIHEHMNLSEPVEYKDCYQVFGHTQLQSPIIFDTWACLDCRRGFIIDTLTHEITKY